MMMPNQATRLPRRRRRKSPSTAMRDLIVQVTEHAIFEFGMARVTTRRISISAGIAEGTIFRYFKTKDELVLAAFKRRHANRAEILDTFAHLDGTVLENITRATEAALRYYEGILWAAIAAMADTSLLPHFREWVLEHTLVGELSNAVECYVDHERSRGLIRPSVEPPIVSEFVLGGCLRHIFGRLFRSETSPSPSDAQFAFELARRITAMIAVEHRNPKASVKSGAAPPCSARKQKAPATAKAPAKAERTSAKSSS